MKAVTLQIVEVTLDRAFNNGPDAITILATTSKGKSVDFQVEVPRSTGESYVRDLDVATYIHIEHVAPPGGRGRLKAIRERRDAATGAKVDSPPLPPADEVH